ncbi:hypothetical protein SDC9_171394 [bioreactor metagenome]|uniref:Uncharacterized protein n=1 Tax=bioreactor metagenome TaxID=1076179 RepID=A0A645GAS3_9ZZZZ
MMNAGLLCDDLCRSFIVAGQHIELDAHILHLADGFYRCLLDLVGNGNHRKCVLAVGEPDHSLGLVAPFIGIF